MIEGMTDEQPDDEAVNPPDETAAAQAALQLARQFIDRDPTVAAAIAAQINESMLSHIQQSTAAARTVIDSLVQSQNEQTAAAIWAAKLFSDQTLTLIYRHDQLMDLFANSVSAEQVRAIAGTVEAHATVQGTVQITATGVVNDGTPDTPADTDVVRARRPLTRNEWLGAVALLASLHGYVMDLRKADQADHGTLLLILAALIVIYALQPPAED